MPELPQGNQRRDVLDVNAEVLDRACHLLQMSIVVDSGNEDAVDLNDQSQLDRLFYADQLVFQQRLRSFEVFEHLAVVPDIGIDPLANLRIYSIERYG